MILYSVIPTRNIFHDKINLKIEKIKFNRFIFFTGFF